MNVMGELIRFEGVNADVSDQSFPVRWKSLPTKIILSILMDGRFQFFNVLVTTSRRKFYCSKRTIFDFIKIIFN